MNVLGPGPVISDKGKAKLIEFVRGQEAIWNPKCPEYPKLELKFAAWQQVQKQMKENGFDFQVLKSHDPDDYDMEDEDDLSDEDWRAGTLADSSSRLDDDSISITGTDIEVEARPSSQGGTKSFLQGNCEETAFLASALREMPEKESRKKMKDIMFILLEDAAPPKV
ncbi:unnamed protein product [Haemonchus placei]|uniref:MADF domain-containing protein n=1 Tax=Haemonchus placei TaxID=6290 RepID=A0A0N4X467_HAEPC|nr:unnamed protein product [Haemonchus placei]